MTTEVRRAVALSVASELARLDRTVSWLAETAHIPEAELRSALALERDFTVTDLADIASALGIPVSELFPRLHP